MRAVEQGFDLEIASLEGPEWNTHWLAPVCEVRDAFRLAAAMAADEGFSDPSLVAALTRLILERQPEVQVIDPLAFNPEEMSVGESRLVRWGDLDCAFAGDPSAPAAVRQLAKALWLGAGPGTTFKVEPSDDGAVVLRTS